ncbi:hypothetical protein [Conexibacter woesei]|uniref:Uncharacterized protein n=1 Tax=Conexibacter woesei (strain DSM 14684 / CCUG 47730 / CIP 108061 / JCM 11494 / NBRC 100937 / ID131577) TaxID=469383 RepID=D3FBA8_CONWI|nr:hypothetical protein [Conexibacter woesei]ADB53300.1 hypothetical protein Cwoe_4888 [Conexibacter woesei DSM 14684]
MLSKLQFWMVAAIVVLVGYAVVATGREEAAPPRAAPYDLSTLRRVSYMNGLQFVRGPVYVDDPSEPRILVGDDESRDVRAILRSEAVDATSCMDYATTPPTATQPPYSNASPFNAVTSRTIHPQSATIVSNALASGIGNLVTEQEPAKEYNHPIYYASVTDPVVELDIPGYSLDGARIPVPAAARAAGGSDGHMAIVTPDCWSYDLWRARRSSGIVRAEIGYRQRYDGLGIVTPAMTRSDPTIGGTTAPYFGAHAGLIRGPELLAGRIDHALFLVIETGTADTTFGLGTVAPDANRRGGNGSSIYPAFKGDAVSAGVRAPMGARFFLDMTETEIDATGAPAWERAIAKAMSRYGGYFGDTGGPGFAFSFEAGFQYTAMGQTNPFETLARSMGLRKDPVWGYTWVFSGRIPWRTKLYVTDPPAP